MTRHCGCKPIVRKPLASEFCCHSSSGEGIVICCIRDSLLYSEVNGFGTAVIDIASPITTLSMPIHHAQPPSMLPQTGLTRLLLKADSSMVSGKIHGIGSLKSAGIWFYRFPGGTAHHPL
ncbi:MAG: hypothetical protein IPP37_20410 [Saprospiraceae bacterium]|nr:hypothetical protein [Saprospiraceae bacterium]